MKKMLLVVLFAVIGFVAFGQETNEKSKMKAPNAITLDAPITFAGTLAANIAGNTDGIKGRGFIIVGQYERAITDKFSAAIRGQYIGLNFTDDYATGPDGRVYIDDTFSSFNIEGHGRYFPWGKTFFLDGMLGYGNLTYDVKQKKDNKKDTYEGNYFLVGAKLGWRIDFGKPGGFILEPAFGYSLPLGTLKISGNIDDHPYELASNIMAQLLVGGPKMSLGVGWAF